MDIWQRLGKHANIVEYVAHQKTGEEMLTLTELCEGGTVLDLIQGKGKLPEE